MNEQTKADILKAIAILKERGWTTGKYFNSDSGNFCLVGALRQSIFGTPYPTNYRNTRDAKAKWERSYQAYEAIYDVTIVKPEKFNDLCKNRRQVVRAEAEEGGARMKQDPLFYTRAKKKKVKLTPFEKQQVEARKQASKQAEWRAERIAAMQVVPVSMEGTFISRMQKDIQGTTLVLGFAEQITGGNMYGVNLISKNPAANHAEDHGTSPFIGRKCRVTIEVLP